MGRLQSYVPARVKWQHLLELLEMPRRPLKGLGLSWRTSQAGCGAAGKPVLEPGGLPGSRAEAAAVLNSPPDPVGEVLGVALKKAASGTSPAIACFCLAGQAAHTSRAARTRRHQLRTHAEPVLHPQLFSAGFQLQPWLNPHVPKTSPNTANRALF